MSENLYITTATFIMTSVPLRAVVKCCVPWLVVKALKKLYPQTFCYCQISIDLFDSRHKVHSTNTHSLHYTVW